MEKEEKEQEKREKCNRKKILLFGISAVVLIGLIIWAIQVIPVANRCKREYVDAKAFVSNWNARSKEDDVLTGGLKISDSNGDHEYQLENGVTLRYSVNTYWWVKYMATAVILEFPEEKPGNVYGLSRMFLEAFDEVADVDAVFNKAREGVDRQSPMVIERFSVGMESETQEAYAAFVATQTVESDSKVVKSGPTIVKSDSIVGYSWNLTIEEWCENFNKNLEYALTDAAQAAYNDVTEMEIETVETSFKEEWKTRNRLKYQPLNTSDFKERAFYTDGVHKNKIYQCALPNWDEALNYISLVVDENGYIVYCECLVLQSLMDAVNQYASGDRRGFFMELYGYFALTGTGAGALYSEALKAVDEFYVSGGENKEVSDKVRMWAATNQVGLTLTCLPNKVGTLENFRTGNWTMKELDSSAADDAVQTPEWSLTQEELDEKFRSSVYEQEAYYGTLTSTYGEFLSDYMEWYDVNFFKLDDERLDDYSNERLDDYSIWYWDADGFAEEYGVSTEYMYEAIVLGNVYNSVLYPEESGTTYYRDAMKVLMLFDEKGEVIKTIVLSQANLLRSNIEDMAYYLYKLYKSEQNAG